MNIPPTTLLHSEVNMYIPMTHSALIYSPKAFVDTNPVVCVSEARSIRITDSNMGDRRL
jgi:hypothetical protein